MDLPSFQRIDIDLTTAPDSPREINFPAERVFFVRAADSGGVLALEALVDVYLQSTSEDPIPAGINTQIACRDINRVYFDWEAQAGVTATFIVAKSGFNGSGLELNAPPARQLVTSAIGTTISAAAVSVTNAATLIAAADATRQSVIVQNLGAADIYLGGSGVTAAAGLKVASGAALAIDKTTAALYGITSAGTADVRVLSEA